MKDGGKTKEQLISQLAEMRQRIAELQALETQSKQAQEELRSSEWRYRLLADNATDIIWTMDNNLQLTYMSPSIESHSGYTPEEMMGMTLEQTYTPASVEALTKAFEEEMSLEKTGVKGQPTSRALELEVYRKDGSADWIETHVTVLRDQDGNMTGVVGVSRKITERKRADEKLREAVERESRMRRELEEEIEKRAEFTRALVHELKTPLTPMLVSSQLLVEELQEQPWLRIAENLSQGTSRLNDRIDELLDVAKGELGLLQLNSKQLAPLQLLRSVADDMGPLASSREQSLILELPSFLSSVWADEDRLRQVLLNLLNNASKWTPKGGKVTLRAREKGQALTVEVQDTGPGIPNEDEQRIFEPYYRRKSDGSRRDGLGLGLSLCKRLIESHGGTIWVKSQKGKGSTFGFSLPSATKKQLEGETEVDLPPENWSR